MNPFVWLSRFRYRRGYGVHSPFAFNFITQVVYQKTPYYKYQELAEEEKRLAPQKDKHWLYESRKVKRLLFRLVNLAQPQTIVDAGTLSASSLYLRAAKEGTEILEVRSQKSEVRSNLLTSKFYLLNSKTPPLGGIEGGCFLYLHDYRHPEFVEEVFRLCAARATAQSLFVVEGIGYTRPMHELWKRMVQDGRVGITFDLYDLGILFFDKTKNKQDYIVNF